MTQTKQLADPRPTYSSALQWVHGLLGNVGPDQWGLPTPCPEFDVRTLAAHLVTTVGRVRLAGAGEDAMSIPSVTPGIPDDELAKAYGDAIDAVWAVWGGADGDAVLDRQVTVPFGTVPGRAAMTAYVNETLVHGWDLATATGQDPEADPAVVTVALAAAKQYIPAERRGGPIPFAAPVEPAPDAGLTEQLANWSGHSTR